MAQRLKGLPARTKYRWDEWVDGSAWAIHKDEDYNISTANMQITLHMRAKSESKQRDTTIRVETVSISREEDGREGLAFQFYEEEE